MRLNSSASLRCRRLLRIALAVVLLAIPAAAAHAQDIGTVTGTVPRATAASKLPHPTVATFFGAASTTVSPYTCSIVAGNAPSAVGAEEPVAASDSLEHAERMSALAVIRVMTATRRRRRGKGIVLLRTERGVGKANHTKIT